MSSDQLNPVPNDSLKVSNNLNLDASGDCWNKNYTQFGPITNSGVTTHPDAAVRYRTKLRVFFVQTISCGIQIKIVTYF